MPLNATTVELAAGGLLAGAGALSAAYCAFVMPRSGICGKVIYRGNAADSRRVAITLDDGPTDPDTMQALDVLADLSAPATFFVIGHNVLRFPQIVQRIHEGGHLIGNHSHDHESLGSFHFKNYWIEQIQRAQDAIFETIGKRPTFFRPPMGIRTIPIYQAIRRTGLHVVNWTHRGLDGVRADTPRILRRLLPAARGGDILVLHDGCVPGRRRNGAATIASLRPLIEGLRQRGLEPVRLDNLLGLPGYFESAVPASRDRLIAHPSPTALHV